MCAPVPIVTASESYQKIFSVFETQQPNTRGYVEGLCHLNDEHIVVITAKNNVSINGDGRESVDAQCRSWGNSQRGCTPSPYWKPL